MALNPEDEPISNINVTPFVDIILVVLIIFMLTSSLILSPSITVDLPTASSGSDTEAIDVDVTIFESGDIIFEGSVVSKVRLADSVKNLLKENKKINTVISADGSVPHGEVVNVMDILKSSGIDKISLSVRK